MSFFSSSYLLQVELPSLMAKASCMVNPLVYVCHNEDFKTAFRNMFQSLKDKYWTRTANNDGSKCISVPLRLISDKENVSTSLSNSANAM